MTSRWKKEITQDTFLQDGSVGGEVLCNLSVQFNALRRPFSGSRKAYNEDRTSKFKSSNIEEVVKTGLTDLLISMSKQELCDYLMQLLFNNSSDNRHQNLVSCRQACKKLYDSNKAPDRESDYTTIKNVDRGRTIDTKQKSVRNKRHINGGLQNRRAPIQDYSENCSVSEDFLTDDGVCATLRELIDACLNGKPLEQNVQQSSHDKIMSMIDLLCDLRGFLNTATDKSEHGGAGNCSGSKNKTNRSEKEPGGALEKDDAGLRRRVGNCPNNNAEDHYLLRRKARTCNKKVQTERLMIPRRVHYSPNDYDDELGEDVDLDILNQGMILEPCNGSNANRYTKDRNYDPLTAPRIHLQYNTC